MMQKQGIISILGSDNIEKTTSTTTLRRTLSADMSSKGWLGQNEFSFLPPMMKKIASSEQITNFANFHDSSSSSSSEDEEERELDMKDVWTSILSQKALIDSSKLPPPYVHPLVKRSSNTLSEKSLRVCTESLGSETGSDVFSSYSSLEVSDENKGYKQQQQQQEQHQQNKETKESRDGKSPTSLGTKKAQLPRARSLPLPLPSIIPTHTNGHSSPSGIKEPPFQMHSQRVDGRLVLKAVSVPQKPYFEANRQDGRLLLTMINGPKEQAIIHDASQISKKDEIIDNNQDEKEANKNINDYKVMEEHKNTTPTTLSFASQRPSITQSFLAKPPRPPLVAATSLSGYQWRAHPTMVSVIDPLITQFYTSTQNKAYNGQKEMVLLRGNKVDWMLPSLKGCKKPRRSLLTWEPHCIATS